MSEIKDTQNEIVLSSEPDVLDDDALFQMWEKAYWILEEKDELEVSDCLYLRRAVPLSLSGEGVFTLGVPYGFNRYRCKKEDVAPAITDAVRTASKRDDIIVDYEVVKTAPWDSVCGQGRIKHRIEQELQWAECRAKRIAESFFDKTGYGEVDGRQTVYFDTRGIRIHLYPLIPNGLDLLESHIGMTAIDLKTGICKEEVFSHKTLTLEDAINSAITGTFARERSGGKESIIINPRPKQWTMNNVMSKLWQQSRYAIDNLIKMYLWTNSPAFKKWQRDVAMYFRVTFEIEETGSFPPKELLYENIKQGEMADLGTCAHRVLEYYYCEDKLSEKDIQGLEKFVEGYIWWLCSELSKHGAIESADAIEKMNELLAERKEILHDSEEQT